jgi:two-component system, OmpR family, sensor histidine kinase KdpD
MPVMSSVYGGGDTSLRHVASAIAFTSGLAAASVAHLAERPITASIVFLFAVTLVGALEGVRGGLVAAVLASIVYNFFLSEPAFSFSLGSIDEYVPLIAFNASAAASGYLVGRLRDRARAAELSEDRVRALFDVSQRLQSAVAIADIAHALDDSGGRQSDGTPCELYVRRGDSLRLEVGQGRFRQLAEDASGNSASIHNPGYPSVSLLNGASGPLGVLVLPPGSRTFRAPEELDALASLVGIAVERCLLFEEQAEAGLLRRSEELKTALLSSVSHDMRTPLNTIKASASSLIHYEAQLAPSTRSELLGLIEEQCGRLDRYTTNLLNLGRIQAGLTGFDDASCDALDVLGAAIGNVRSLKTGHVVTKTYNVSFAHVVGDAVMLEQVFFNVLENAARYSEGGSTIRVSAEEEGDCLLVLVADEGAGVAAEDRDRIFDRFARAGLPQREGSGLGLSIAKGFIEAFGGSIEALPNDTVGKGTVIRMTLRLAREERAR